jgi:hypothetical protein
MLTPVFLLILFDQRGRYYYRVTYINRYENIQVSFVEVVFS